MEVVQIQGEHFFHVAESKKDPTAASSTEETLESRRLKRLKAFTSNKAILDNKEIKRKQLEAEKRKQMMKVEATAMDREQELHDQHKQTVEDLSML